VGLIVLAPSPLAPGIKLVRLECIPSFETIESLFRALEGDNGSFSTLAFLRLGVAGTANFPGLSVGGPMNDIVADVAVPARLWGGGRLTGD